VRLGSPTVGEAAFVDVRTGGASLIGPGVGVVRPGCGATGTGTGGPRNPGPGLSMAAAAFDAKATAATSVAIPVKVSLCNLGSSSVGRD
jgi:hypothetical protein